MTLHLPKATLRRRLRIALELLRGRYNVNETFSLHGERSVLLRPRRSEDPLPPALDGYEVRSSTR
jgi:hypothetical protein